MIQHAIEHYLGFCSRVFILDNMSDDNSVELASSYENVSVIQWSSDNEHNDIMQSEIKANIYRDYSRQGGKYTKDVADWVIACDMDEFLYHPDISTLLHAYKKQGVTFPKVRGYEMVSQQSPIKGDVLVQRFRNGIPSENIAKRVIFDPILDISYSVGAHPRGPLHEKNYLDPRCKESDVDELYLLHYKMLGDRVKERSRISAPRIKRFNEEKGWGQHYYFSEDKLEKRITQATAQSSEVITRSGYTYSSHIQKIFIVGPPRSGTSIMGNSLRKVLDVAGFSENHIIPKFNKLVSVVSDMYKGNSEYGKGSALSVYNEEYFRNSLLNKLNTIIEMEARQGIYIDKTPGIDMVSSLKFVEKYLANKQIIFCGRRGIENICSRMRKWPEVDFETHCNMWAVIMEEWLSVRGYIDYLYIDQHEMLIDPVGISDKICRYLGFEDKRKLLAEAFRNDRPEVTGTDISISLESCEWSGDQKEYFLGRCSRVMDEMGYSFDKSYWN